MKRWLLISFGSLFIVTAYYCFRRIRYDRELEYPDIDASGMGHGMMLTPLGCLVYTPFAYLTENDEYNVATYLNGKEVSSVAVPYSELQKQIVFQFYRDGSLDYWFKKDYLKPAIDTLIGSKGEHYVSHTIRSADDLSLKRIFRTGKWEANFKDSTLTIDFGPNDFGLVAFVGKYTSLGSSGMALRETHEFDSLVNGVSERFTRKINTYYESY